MIKTFLAKQLAKDLADRNNIRIRALRELPQNLVLGGVQNRLMTAMADAYDASTTHYVFAQQAMLAGEQKPALVTRVLQRVATARNSPTPAPIRYVTQDARATMPGEDAPPQAMHGLACLTQDSVEKLDLAASAVKGQGQTEQWHLSPKATGSVAAGWS